MQVVFKSSSHTLRVRSFGTIRIGISDLRSLRSWSFVHLIYHDPNDLGPLILIISKERTLSRVVHTLNTQIRPLYQVGRLEEVKTMENSETVILKSGRSRLREVIVYWRFQLYGFDWENIWCFG